MRATAGLLGTLHLIGYLLGALASPSLNAKVDALALCRASHFVFACAMLVCGLTSDITTMAASRFVAGLAAGFGLGLGQLSGPAIGGILADWFGPSAIGWFAAAIYSAGVLAAAGGLFGRTRITM